MLSGTQNLENQGTIKEPGYCKVPIGGALGRGFDWRPGDRDLRHRRYSDIPSI
jgi:hypothetical protein